VAKDQHVVPRGRKWAVVGEGNCRATRLTESRQEALDLARMIARNQGADVFIHDRDGQIQVEDVFGHPSFYANGAQSAAG
jgi:hypothetical protein